MSGKISQCQKTLGKLKLTTPFKYYNNVLIIGIKKRGGSRCLHSAVAVFDHSNLKMDRSISSDFFLFIASEGFHVFTAVKAFLTVCVPKWITLHALITVKCCEENTKYSICSRSMSLSLTRSDNNYSALRQRT